MTKKPSELVLLYLLLLTCCHFLTVFSLIYINEDKSFLIVQLSNINSFPQNQTVDLVYYGGGGDYKITPDLYNISAGKVVYMSAPVSIFVDGVEPYKKMIFFFAQQGCLGIITSRPGDTILSNFPYFTFRDYPIPVGVVIDKIEKYIQPNHNNSVNITFMGWDTNAWEYLYAGPNYMALVAILLLLFLVNFCYASYLIVRWIRGNGIDWSLGFICLNLECLGNFIRIFEMIFFPVHPNFLYLGLSVLFTLPVCISLVSSIMIVFFWLDLTSDPFYHGKFLGVMRVPAFIFIGIILAIELIFDILRNVGTTANLTRFVDSIVGFYTAVKLIVVIFNFVAAYRILNRLKDTQEKESKNLQVLIHRIVYSGVFTIIGMIILLGLEIKTFVVPIGTVTLWWLSHFTYFVQSLFLITIFQGPKKKGKTNTTSSSIKEESINTS